MEKKQSEKKAEKIKKVKKEDSEKVREIKFIILAIVCLILFSASLAPVTLQNDTYYTIKIGELISKTKTIDMQEHFSWHEGLPYTYPHWLYDLMIYIFYSIAGFKGIFISTVVFACILGVVLSITNSKISKNTLISFLISLGTIYLLKDYIAARAQLVTFILFELEILCMENFLEKKQKRYAFGILAIGVLIANVHAAVWPFTYVIFLPYLGEYILNLDYLKAYYWLKRKYYNDSLKKYEKKNNKEKIDEINLKINKSKLEEESKLEKQEKRRKNPYKIKMVKNTAVKWLALIMIIYAFTGLLTPIGDTPYTWTYRTMKGNTTENINEHLPLTLINEKDVLIVLVFVIAILLFTDVKIRLKDLFMLSGLALLMLMTRRQASMFFIFGGASLATLITDLVNKYDKEGTDEFKKIMTSILGTVATLLIIALMMFMQIKGKIQNKFVSESLYPVDAAEYIKENLDLKLNAT